MTDTPVEALEPKAQELLREVYINDAVWLEGLAFVSTPEKAERFRDIAERIRALSTPPQAPGVVDLMDWGSDPTPEKAAAQLRQYAANRRKLTGTCPPGDNIFEDAAAIIDRLSTLVSAPPVSAGELVERLRAELAPERLEQYLSKQWDVGIRAPLLHGDKSDGPRLCFENALECKDELIDEAASALTAANADRDRLRKDYNTARVYGDEQSARSHQQRERAEAAEADRDKWKLRAEQFQRARAELADMLNGTPCAEIRWQQEKEALEADRDRLARELARANELLSGDEMLERAVLSAIVIDELRTRAEALARELEEAREALRKIAAPRSCGCVPCTGQCRSQEALEIEANGIREVARTALRSITPAGGGPENG